MKQSFNYDVDFLMASSNFASGIIFSVVAANIACLIGFLLCHFGTRVSMFLFCRFNRFGVRNVIYLLSHGISLCDRFIFGADMSDQNDGSR